MSERVAEKSWGTFRVAPEAVQAGAEGVANVGVASTVRAHARSSSRLARAFWCGRWDEVDADQTPRIADARVVAAGEVDAVHACPVAVALIDDVAPRSARLTGAR